LHIQIPGFHWLQGLKVDTFGRSFADIVPQAKEVLQKCSTDWRVANILKLLVEIGLDSGGRQITVRSLISIVNKTTGKIHLAMHSDPHYKPHKAHLRLALTGNPERDALSSDEDLTIERGDSVQVPTLLFESALRHPGSHLGSLWIKPGFEPSNEMYQMHRSSVDDSASRLTVDFTSKPVQFARIVSESSSMFETSRGRDIAGERAASGMQLSCPVLDESGDRLAPYCFVVEIARSPIVSKQTDAALSLPKTKEMVHGPVAYSLSIHPPLFVTNLLAVRGRFELMHAVHRTVLWFGDLDPGQETPIHTVGLDSPLILCMNLGFAKTMVGEGALVHHGTDSRSGIRGELFPCSPGPMGGLSDNI
jgi:hypothetical protein